MNPFFGGAKGEGFRINARIYMETNFSLSYALKLVCREMSGAAIGGVLPRACMWYMRSRSEHKISHYQVYVYYVYYLHSHLSTAHVVAIEVCCRFTLVAETFSMSRERRI